MKELHLWNFILQKISKGKTVILIAVVDHEKGSPGKEGFKMAVAATDDYIGSVGGGVMEYNIIKECAEMIKENIPVNKLEKLFHNKRSSVKRSGLICSGSQTNFTISLSKIDVKLIKIIRDFILTYKPGKIIFSGKGIKFSKGKVNEDTFVFNYTRSGGWTYEETVGIKNFLYIAGGGHVGIAVSKIMSLLDFHVTVIDDVVNLPLVKENTFADKIIISPFNKTGKFIKEGKQTYVLILTKNYHSDIEVLMQVTNKKIRYTGIMGTKVKIKKIFNEAIKEGITKEQLKKIHAPVGIDINSDTPEEIAVSIAAEIIRVKNS
ncbi:MAG TPA: XdhC family protein [Ignavibacteria bacterium]|nr:XdhC family protein [Ignavibacteria bacterium]